MNLDNNTFGSDLVGTLWRHNENNSACKKSNKILKYQQTSQLFADEKKKLEQ